jgi:photosystem II stability/assembly factor-like uncharacterized protein
MIKLLNIGVAAAVFLGFCASAWAQTDDYYALDHPSIAIKSPGKTPLVSIVSVGSALFAVGQHGVIIRSLDDGLSWTQMSVPVDVTLTALYFKNPTEGWAVGHYGVILHTQDGGLIWQKALDGLDVIAALNTTARSAGDPTANPDAQLKQRVAAAFQRVGPSKPFLAIGPCGNGLLAAGQQDMAMFSTDGRNWQEWTSKIENPDFQNIYAILNDGGFSYLIGESGMIWRGDANCMNFKEISGPSSATLFGGVVTGTQGLLAYGLNGSVYASPDGLNWTTIPLPTDAVVDSGIALKPGGILLSTLDGNFYLSKDDGRSFSKLPFSVPFEASGIAIAPDGALVVVGNGGARVFSATALN